MWIANCTGMTIRTRQEIADFASEYAVSDTAVIDTNPPCLILRVRPFSTFPTKYTYHVYQETRPDRYAYRWAVHEVEED